MEENLVNDSESSGSAPGVDEFEGVLQAVAADAERYLLTLDDRPILAEDRIPQV